MSSKPVTTEILFVVGLILIGLSWASIHRAAELPEELRRAYGQREYPLPIRGLQLDLLSEVTTLDPSDTLPSQYPDRVLLLVSGGSCAKSQENQALWKQLLTSIPNGGIDEVWLLSLSEHEHLRALEAYLRDASAVPIRTLRSSHKDTFGLRSGLSAVPATLLLDSAGRIQMNLVGLLSQGDISLVLADLGGDKSGVSSSTKLSVPGP